MSAVETLVRQLGRECDTEEQIARYIEGSNLSEGEKWETSDMLGMEYPYFD